MQLNKDIQGQHFPHLKHSLLFPKKHGKVTQQWIIKDNLRSVGKGGCRKQIQLCRNNYEHNPTV